MQHQDFLQHLAAADVVLDPFYFGGCNSSCDAFSLAAPVVTLPGFLLPGRFTLGLYREMRMEDCIARSPEEFVEIALRLGGDADLRESIRKRIAERSERLFDRPDTGRALGRALLEIAEIGL
jgi:predicted O-linked N-acetylglucosamine transferase (SPINDLY family)